MNEEILYIGRNNEIRRTFQENGAPKDVSSAVKIILELFDSPGTNLASWNTIDHSSLFDTSGLANGLITFKPGASTIASEMKGRHFARYTVQTASEPQGVVFPEFAVRIVD